MSRRGLLVGALTATGAAALAGCTDGARQGSATDAGGLDDGSRGRWCVDASTLVQRDSIGSASLVYDITGQPAAFRFDPAFHGQLGRWLTDWNRRSALGSPAQIWSYGAYVAESANCHSYHAAGRAFDISRLRAGNQVLVSCRTDLWHSLSASRVAQLNRRYWTLAASLHMHFAYVLTHYYDAAHDNHIHVDNGRSGAGLSRFDPTSRVQCQAVQAISTYLWRRAAEVTGSWDDARPVARTILAAIGRSGHLTRGENWQAFLAASVARG